MCWVFATLLVRLVGVEGRDGKAVKKEDWETGSINNNSSSLKPAVKKTLEVYTLPILTTEENFFYKGGDSRQLL